MDDVNEKLNALLSDPGSMAQIIARYLPLLQELTRDTSQTTQLLYALRPFLKDGKQDKVERAARLARLITIGKRFLSEGGGFPV